MGKAKLEFYAKITTSDGWDWDRSDPHRRKQAAKASAKSISEKRMTRNECCRPFFVFFCPYPPDFCPKTWCFNKICLILQSESTTTLRTLLNDDYEASPDTVCAPAALAGGMPAGGVPGDMDVYRKDALHAHPLLQLRATGAAVAGGTSGPGAGLSLAGAGHL